MRAIYIAAPLAEAGMCCGVADACRLQGGSVISTWHEVVYQALQRSGVPSADPGRFETAERRAILSVNIAELAACDTVLAITDRGLPRATFAEIGYALALGKRVVWLQGYHGAGANIFDAHPRVTKCEILVQAIQEACR